MEDPIKFDIWACVLRGHGKQAREDIFNWFPGSTQRDIRFAVNRSIVRGEPIQIAFRLTWSQVQAIRTARPEWAIDIRVYQEGYTPEEFVNPSSNKYCEIHDYFHGGYFGCHVCRGFFIP